MAINIEVTNQVVTVDVTNPDSETVDAVDIHIEVSVAWNAGVVVSP